MSAVETWTLVREIIEYPNPEVGTVVNVRWVRIVGNRYYNEGGSYCIAGRKDTILDTLEVEDWLELPKERTTGHIVLLESKAKLDAAGTDDRGWLSPEGVIHRCRYHAHDGYARVVLSRTVRSLERDGWCRVGGENGRIWPMFKPGKGPTEAQAQFLLERNVI